MGASQEALRKLVARLGPYRGPSSSGFLQFCHRRLCGDAKFRLGVSVTTGKFSCFRCGLKGHVEDLVPGLTWAGIRPPKASTPRLASSDAAAPSAELWKPISAVGATRLLEEKALAYLASRGISRLRAASLGLGYGSKSPYTGCVIHPWRRPDGSLGGFQARKPYDPDDGSPKIIHPYPDHFPNLYTPRMGGMFAFELIPQNSPVLLAEGPYDTYSSLRVIPTAGLMGSIIFKAQIRRLQKKNPSVVYYGLDPDTFDPFWIEGEHRYGPPKARENLRLLGTMLDCPIRVCVYDEPWEGDLGGKADKSPHDRKVIAELIENAAPYDPTF